MPSIVNTLFVYLFQPITLQQLNSVTSIHTFCCLCGPVAANQTAVRQLVNIAFKIAWYSSDVSKRRPGAVRYRCQLGLNNPGRWQHLSSSQTSTGTLRCWVIKKTVQSTYMICDHVHNRIKSHRRSIIVADTHKTP